MDGALEDAGVVLGQGEHRYRVQSGWGRLPEGWDLGDVAGVATDAADNVYVFNRGPHPMIVLDRDGNFLRSWGEGIFKNPHGIDLATDGYLYCTDAGDHTVRKFTVSGELLMVIGVPGEPSPFMSGQPFCKCTHTALAPNGDIYVSDGYGNARVHRYSPDGRWLSAWGQPGIGPGEFNCPHNIHCDADGYVYVADRENHRVQVFDGDGNVQAIWHNMHRPSALFMTRCKCPLCYIGEIGPYLNFNRGAPNLGPRISIWTPKGELVTRLESNPAAGTEPGQFMSPHGIAVDSRGDLVVGEVAVTAWPSLFPGKPIPKPLRSLQKLVKLPPEPGADAKLKS